MEAPSGSPPWLAVHRGDERPELWERSRTDDRFHRLWPEYNHHGAQARRIFGSLWPRHAHLQAFLVDRRSDELVGRARTIPFAWDGSLSDLPAGFDALGERALDDGRAATALSALAAEVLGGHEGEGLGRIVVAVMADLAHFAGLTPLLVPLRPNRKEQYPLIPIEEYASWRRGDGLPFDPWLRVHVRMGAAILRAEPRSLAISGPVDAWEDWTGLSLPADGHYVFPHGLAPLAVVGGVGRYWEPNVWMLHGR